MRDPCKVPHPFARRACGLRFTPAHRRDREIALPHARGWSSTGRSKPRPGLPSLRGRLRGSLSADLNADRSALPLGGAPYSGHSLRAGGLPSLTGGADGRYRPAKNDTRLSPIGGNAALAGHSMRTGGLPSDGRGGRGARRVRRNVARRPRRGKTWMHLRPSCSIWLCPPSWAEHARPQRELAEKWVALPSGRI